MYVYHYVTSESHTVCVYDYIMEEAVPSLVCI
jgi:hypothetical protein